MVVHGDDTTERRLAAFARRNFNAVPVVDDEGHLLGTVTKLSLLPLVGPGAPTEAASPSPLRARDVMDTRAVWVEPQDALDAVVRQMTRHHVRGVPVVERSGSRRRPRRNGQRGRRAPRVRGRTDLSLRVDLRATEVL